MLIPSSIVARSFHPGLMPHSMVLDPFLSGVAAPPINGGVGPAGIIPSVLEVMVALRGGGAALELFAHNKASALDISRVRMRLEGLQVYATLCALLTNACLRLYSSVKVSKDEKEKQKFSTRIALDLFYVCVVISVLFGSYTTIVFGLFSLLSKTALGRGYDTEFIEFWRHSTDIRESGFESFLYSLVAFELSFVLSLFLKFKGRRRIMLVALACIILAFSASRWTKLLFLASKYLFPLRAETEF